jgi:uncharacterized protein YjbI with pentapeptide repeats/beta-lactamase regulating signal transducer with metallopeptidase domain
VNAPWIAAAAIVGLWALAALALLVRLAVALFRLEKLKHDALPLGMEYRETLRQWTSVSAREGDVRICVTDGIDVPVAVGLFDAMVLLPQHLLDTLEASEIDQISLHELAHLLRHDDWTNGFQRVVSALLFFNPAVWFIARQMDIEREVACDDYVLELTGAVRPYAFCLTKMAEMTAWPHQPLAAPGVFVTRKNISIRIERLLRSGRAISSKISPATATVVVAGLLGVFALTGSVTPSVAFALQEMQPPGPIASPAPPATPAPVARVHTHVAKPAAPVVVSHVTAVPATAAPQPAPPSTPPKPAPIHIHIPAIDVHVPAKDVTVPPIRVAVNAGAEGMNCSGCDFSHARLAGKDFSGSNLSGSDFAGADLTGAKFAHANVTGSDFSHANLRNADFSGANMSGCDLTSAELTGARFDGANMTGCDVDARKLSPAQMRAIVEHCTGCDFEGAHLDGQDLSGMHFTGLNFENASLRNANLQNASFRGVNFGGADFAGANVNGASFIGCNFSGAHLRSVDLSHATFTGSSLGDADMNR